MNKYVLGENFPLVSHVSASVGINNEFAVNDIFKYVCISKESGKREMPALQRSAYIPAIKDVFFPLSLFLSE